MMTKSLKVNKSSLFRQPQERGRASSVYWWVRYNKTSISILFMKKLFKNEDIKPFSPPICQADDSCPDGDGYGEESSH